VRKRTFYNKKAKRARKDLTFVWGYEIMDLQNEKRLNPLLMGTTRLLLRRLGEYVGSTT
tara:strand:- start:483 stop:659 length:177 start_codon:yes stop_codon:yes gene_type:complete